MRYPLPSEYKSLSSPKREETLWEDFLTYLGSLSDLPIDSEIFWKGLSIRWISSYYYVIRLQNDHSDTEYFCRYDPGVESFSYYRNGYLHRRDGPASMKLWRPNSNFTWSIGGVEFSFSEFIDRTSSRERKKDLLCEYAT